MPPTSLASSGEKLGTNPRIGRSTCRGLCRERFFLGVVGSVQICRRLVKGYHVWGPLAGSVRVVLVMFSPAGFTSI
jgi:plasmid stabilization system protein ParE